MLFRRRRTDVADDPDVVVEHGPSLAKGPALIVGSILVAFGLSGLLVNADFPSWSQSFPDGNAQGESWLGFEVNGWTNWLCIAAGALLLFGAAQHHLAKLMSLLVGLAMAAAAIIALSDGQDVLGLAAANGLTKLGFGVTAIVLLVNALMPRTKRRRHVGTTAAAAPATTTGAAPVADRDTTTGRRHRFGRFGRDRDGDGVPDRQEDETVVAAREREAAARRP
jgi:hypothetical protein